MKRWLAFLLMAVLMLTAGTALADIYMLTAEELASIPMTMADTPENVLVTYKVTQPGSDKEDHDLGLIMSTDTGIKLREIDASVPNKHEGGIAFNYDKQALVITGPDEYSYTIMRANWQADDAPVTFYTTNTKEDGRWGATDGAAIYPENKLGITPERNKFILKTNENTKNLPDGTYTATLTLKAMNESTYNLTGSAVITFTVEHHEHTLTYTDYTPSAHYIKCSDPDCQMSSGTHTRAHQFETLDCGTKKCTLCNGTYPPANVGHSGGTATCKDQAKCQYCGLEYGPLGGHSGGAATCSEKAICSVCLESYGDLKPHQYNESEWVRAGEDWHTHPCKACGAGDPVSMTWHIFVDTYDPLCETCGFTRLIEPGTLKIVKQLSGIAPEDLPDGTAFVFDFFDVAGNSLGMPSVTITKEMLANGDNDVELTLDREMMVVVGEKISSTQIAGYTCETTLEWGEVGEEYVFDSGSYILAGESAEVVFTNTFTPINPGQEVPDDIDLPKTGDESNLALWACAMLLSSIACTLLLRKKREA